MTIDQYLNIAIDSVKASGIILNDFYKKSVSFEQKRDKSIVTEIDNKSNDAIINLLSNSFPNHAILSEESGLNNKKSDYLWIIDPLDGTSNYLHQIPFFCVSISLMHKNEPLIAVIFDPLRDELFTAIKNDRSRLNGKILDLRNINTENTQYISLINGRSIPLKKRTDKIFSVLNPPEFRIRNLGAAALELAYVASNRLDGLIIMGNNSWDINAGILLIQEAGGLVTDLQNVNWNYKSENVVAGPKHLHKRIIEKVISCY